MQIRKSSNEENKDIKKNKFRYSFVFLFIAFSILAILYQFARFMLGTENTPLVSPKLPKYRGSIKDRYGSILALQTKLYNLSASKNLVTELELAARVLSPIIDLSETAIRAKFEKTSSNYVYIKKKISESEMLLISDAIKENRLKGFMLEEIANRTYPENKLASTVIGFLGDDGYGLAGIEYSAQNILSPPETSEGYTGRGYDIYLSLDSSIQYIMQKESKKAFSEWMAEGVIFLAADAKTGDILGYVSEPSADLNKFAESTQEQLLDRPANYTYEPGSVFKIFTLASLLDLGVSEEGKEYYCNGIYKFGHSSLAPITCLKPHGIVTPEGIIQKSCNVGLAQMVENCSSEDFYNKLKDFGFGAKTKVELPGESAGIFSSPKYWSIRTKPTIAMGQEIGVTALQILEASTAFANDGKRLRLSLISKITDSDGKILYLHKPRVESQPISGKVANELLRYMKAENGIGWRASVGDVPLAVKTGTAQMAEKGKRGYSKSDFIASTIALFPAESPQIVLYMAVIKPRGKIYGASVVAPIIKNVASQIIDYYGLKRDGALNIQHSGYISTVSGEKIILGNTMPNLINKSKKELQSLFDSDINKHTYKIILNGSGYVYEQVPEEGSALKDGDTIILKLK